MTQDKRTQDILEAIENFPVGAILTAKGHLGAYQIPFAHVRYLADRLAEYEEMFTEATALLGSKRNGHGKWLLERRSLGRNRYAWSSESVKGRTLGSLTAIDAYKALKEKP